MEWKSQDKEQLMEHLGPHLRSWEAFTEELSSGLSDRDRVKVRDIVEGLLIRKLFYTDIKSYIGDFHAEVAKQGVDLEKSHPQILKLIGNPDGKENALHKKIQEKLTLINSQPPRMYPGEPLKVSSHKDLIEDYLDHQSRANSVYSPDFWRRDCSLICRKVRMPTETGCPTGVALTDPVEGWPSFFVGFNGGGLKRFSINRTSQGPEAGQIEYVPSNDPNRANSLKTVEGLDGLGKGTLFRDRYGFLGLVTVAGERTLTYQDVGALTSPDSATKLRYKSTCVHNTGAYVLIAALRQSEPKVDIIQLSPNPENGKQVMPSRSAVVDVDKQTAESELIWATNRKSSVAAFYLYAQTEGKLSKINVNHQGESLNGNLQPVLTLPSPNLMGKSGCLIAVSSCNAVAILIPTETGYTVHLVGSKKDDGKPELLSKYELRGVGRIEFLDLHLPLGSDHYQLFYVSRDCHATTVNLKLGSGDNSGKFQAIERVDGNGKFSDLYQVVSAKAQTGITAGDKVVVLLTHKASYGSELAIMELNFNYS